MGVAAIVNEKGEITNMTSPEKTEKTKGGSTMGKDDFLQLLVAQMKYQDPLEPTSNTEFISQYAQFSQVEQMQNMSQTMELTRASSLVGRTVQILSTDENGLETEAMGKVDYVKYENGKAYVVIDEKTYDLDDVKYICDEDYLTAMALGTTLRDKLLDLPEVDKVSYRDKEKVEEVLKIYDGLNDYQKTFIGKDMSDLIEAYRKRLEEVIANAEAPDEDGENVEGADTAEGGTDKEGTTAEGGTDTEKTE